ncbi:MAG: MBL fold metallo-hydrolase [Oligoflexia bacterium]|nr:MBL fold metallo-hydrolase [Oligoflexia bacterium]
MIVTILGSGTSSGVPLIACRCAVCRSRNPKDKRTRASIWVQSRGKSLIVDTGPDFRAQALREKIPRVDAVLYTHPHADHVHGIDDLRAYNFSQKTSIPIYGHEWTIKEIPQKFSYIFQGHKEGGGIPMLDLHEFDPNVDVMNIVGVPVIPILLNHGRQHTMGYRFDTIAYITDTSYIPTQSLEKLRGLSTLILDCVQVEPHKTHLNVAAALEIIEELKPERTFLTHLGHEFGYNAWMKKGKLPKGVALAYDGLKIS